jgi:hypothetical protein
MKPANAPLAAAPPGTDRDRMRRIFARSAEQQTAVLDAAWDGAIRVRTSACVADRQDLANTLRMERKESGDDGPDRGAAPPGDQWE